MKSSNLLPVPDFPKYFADIHTGTIYSSKKSGLRKLNATEAPSGYLTLTLYNNGKGKSTTVHCVIMATYLGTWNWDKPEVDHKDHNRKNNCISNLQLATRLEQMSEVVTAKISESMKGNKNHSKEALSNAVKGSRNVKAKLTEEDVIAIRKEFSEATCKKSEFVREKSEEYNVHWSTVYRVLSGKQWSHIKIS